MTTIITEATATSETSAVRGKASTYVTNSYSIGKVPVTVMKITNKDGETIWLDTPKQPAGVEAVPFAKKLLVKQYILQLLGVYAFSYQPVGELLKFTPEKDLQKGTLTFKVLDDLCAKLNNTDIPAQLPTSFSRTGGVKDHTAHMAK